MKTAKIRVQNIKCEGCVDTIRKSLSGISAISDLLIDKNTQLLQFSYDTDLNLENVTTKLNQLGYPVEDLNPDYSELPDDISSRLK